jgi:hypothetical protein
MIRSAALFRLWRCGVTNGTARASNNEPTGAEGAKIVMNYGVIEIVGGVLGAALCLLGILVLNADAVSRVTEAVLDRIEVRLAHRQQKIRARAERAAAARERLPLVELWQPRSG